MEDIKYSVYQRKDLKWVGAIELGKDPLGKRIRKVVYGSTEKEVVKKVNSIIIDMENGDYSAPNKITLITFLNEYFNVCSGKWEDTTRDLYRMYIDVHFKPYFKEMKLTDIKPITLDKFYNYKLNEPREVEKTIQGKKVKKLVDPLSPNTVIKLNKFLKAAFNYAYKNKLVTSNPTDYVMLAKKKKYIPTVYGEEQFLQLLDSVMGTDDEIPIILGAGCGLRRGEIFGLRWKDVDFELQTITISKTRVRFTKTIDKDRAKNETSQRTIIAPKYVIETLERYASFIPNIKTEDKIITSWEPGTYSERFKKLLVKFGMPHIRLHDLRHYNAVIMMQRGIPDKVAAERLGHSQVSTLRDIYQHVLKDMDTTAATEINTMFKNKNSQEPREE